MSNISCSISDVLYGIEALRPCASVCVSRVNNRESIQMKRFKPEGQPTVLICCCYKHIPSDIFIKRLAQHRENFSWLHVENNRRREYRTRQNLMCWDGMERNGMDVLACVDYRLVYILETFQRTRLYIFKIYIISSSHHNHHHHHRHSQRTCCAAYSFLSVLPT